MAVTGLLAVATLVRLGVLAADVEARLVADALAVPGADPAGVAARFDTVSTALGPIVLAGLLLLALGGTLALRLLSTHRSRAARSGYLSFALLLAITLAAAADLLYRGHALLSGAAWTAAVLVLTAAMTGLAPAIGRWLPESMRIKPSRVFTEGARKR